MTLCVLFIMFYRPQISTLCPVPTHGEDAGQLGSGRVRAEAHPALHQHTRLSMFWGCGETPQGAFCDEPRNQAAVHWCLHRNKPYWKMGYRQRTEKFKPQQKTEKST